MISFFVPFSSRSMDKNGTMTIDWNEWKKYPTLQPAENIPEIILYWKHSTVSIFSHKPCTQSKSFKTTDKAYLVKAALFMSTAK